MAIERRRIYFTGHVQGVGFRMTTRRLAMGQPIAGYVRNLDDGRVELLVEGDPPVLTRFVGSIQREFGPSIRETEETVEPRDESRLGGFSIR